MSTVTEIKAPITNSIDQKDSQRIHYMDNLRAYAMLLGIFFHAALAYSPLVHNLWLTADVHQSRVVDVLAWYSHLFRMPLFFLVAGFFGCFLVEKRGIHRTIQNRLKRILLPFIIFLPIVITGMIIALSFGMDSVVNKSPMLQFITEASKNPDNPPPPLTTMHLWFLYNLLYFYVLSLILYKTGITLTLQGIISKSPILTICILPILMIPALITQAIPHPSPESFIPALWSFGFYGLFFLFGFLLYNNKSFLDRIQPYWPIFLLLGSIAYGVIYSQLPVTVSLEDTLVNAGKIVFSWEHAIGAILEAYSSLLLTVAMLLIGRKYLNQANRISRYIADASYWIYLIHLPLLFYIQFALLDTNWGLLTEFLVSSLGTIAIGLVSYMLLVRWTFIGQLLNGKRKAMLQ